VFVKPEEFPEATLDAVSLYSIPEAFLDDHAEAMNGKAVGRTVHPEMCCAVMCAVLPDAYEIL